MNQHFQGWTALRTEEKVNRVMERMTTVFAVLSMIAGFLLLAVEVQILWSIMP